MKSISTLFSWLWLLTLLFHFSSPVSQILWRRYNSTEMKITNSLCTFSHGALWLLHAWQHSDSICVSLWVTLVREQTSSFHLPESLITAHWIVVFPPIDNVSQTLSQNHSFARNQLNYVQVMFEICSLSCGIWLYYQADFFLFDTLLFYLCCHGNMMKK